MEVETYLTKQQQGPHSYHLKSNWYCNEDIAKYKKR